METRDQKENWKKALGEASVNPSPTVWEGVELQLDKLEVSNLRRTVVFYKWLAAACVTLAVLAVGATYNIGDDESVSAQEITSLTQVAPTHSHESARPDHEQFATPPLTEPSYSGNIERTEDSKTISTFTFEPLALWSQRFKSTNFSNTQWYSNSSLTDDDKATLIAEEAKNQRVNVPVVEKENAKSPLAKDENTAQSYSLLEDLQKSESPEKTSIRQQEKFWTSIGFSAGTFNNTTPTSATVPASALQSFSAGQTAASESNSPGYTYAVNLTVGTKVSKRWLIQGGMSYISQLSDYTATSVVVDQGSQQTLRAASINQFEKKAENNNSADAILSSTPYLVNNNIQLISFPVQAGYLVVDRKLALQVNSGVSTDLFMQNTITPEAANLEKTTQGRGDDSPYRPVNFSGLIGTEVSYRFGESYRISVSPGLRYPFNSIYKTDLGIKSSPLTFDVAVRFRYILK